MALVEPPLLLPSTICDVAILYTCTCVFADITFAYQFDSYIVGESDGNVTICVEITNGCLERGALIGYGTVDGTARCT